MKQSPIIVIINKKTYTLCASDVESIRNIPNADRQQLVTLLETIKRIESPVQPVAEQVAAKVNATLQAATTVSSAGSMPDYRNMMPENLNSGDADAVMAQLIMEEGLKKKPGITKHSIYKWVVGVAVIIILLVLIL